MTADESQGLDLAEVESAVQEALRAGRADGLTVLGYGEITLVVGWPGDGPTSACKRLPELPSDAAAETFAAQFDRYLDLLRSRGVVPVPSSFRTVPTATGRVAGYVVQPVLAPGTLGPDILRAAEPDPSHPFLNAVCSVVPRVVDDRTGLDAQVSNWAMLGTGPEADVQYLDVSTPMLFRDGRIELDMGLFLAAYPWPLRRPIGRFVAPGVVGAYRDPRHVLVDLAANLLKEHLGQWVPAVLAVVNELVTPAVTEDEVRSYYASDARLWEIMLRLRRADRWWQGTVRRRPYPFLLPGPITR
jgi:hypothetical protein